MTVTTNSGGKLEARASAGAGASWIALGLGALALLAVPIAGFGTKHGYWGWQQGLYGGFFTALFDAVAALLVGVSALFRALTRGGRGRAVIRAVASLVIGLSALGIFVYWTQIELPSVPRIHDISTDSADPPAFVTLAETRKHLPPPVNPTGYDPADAAQQAKGYPDIKPALLDMPPAAAFAKALVAAKAVGWQVVASDAKAGRIEATQTSFWMGFTDDIVIRVRADGNKSKVDVRSQSRVGGSDFGANAKRIRRYLQQLETA